MKKLLLGIFLGFAVFSQAFADHIDDLVEIFSNSLDITASHDYSLVGVKPTSDRMGIEVTYMLSKDLLENFKNQHEKIALIQEKALRESYCFHHSLKNNYKRYVKDETYIKYLFLGPVKEFVSLVYINEDFCNVKEDDGKKPKGLMLKEDIKYLNQINDEIIKAIKIKDLYSFNQVIFEKEDNILKNFFLFNKDYSDEEIDFLYTQIYQNLYKHICKGKKMKEHEEFFAKNQSSVSYTFYKANNDQAFEILVNTYFCGPQGLGKKF